MVQSLEKQLDSRQLKILLTLLEQQSVTRAAEILGQSQPRVSMALRRLRKIIGDPLLVRSGAKLVPTERALEIVDPLRSAIAGIEEIINPATGFQPDAATDTFRIASADCMEAFFLPNLISSVRKAAPHTRLQIRSIDEGYDYAIALENGELDAVIGNWPSPPINLRTVHLFADKTVCLFSHYHPFAGKSQISMKDYLASEHLAPAPASNAIPGPIDGQLLAHGLKRDIRVMVPEFNLVPYVLESSNLLFTSCRQFAQHYSDLFPIAFADAPEELGQMRFYLLWHERAQGSSANLWLRDQIKSIAKSFAGGGSAGLS